jgi:hypothetical protein
MSKKDDCSTPPQMKLRFVQCGLWIHARYDTNYVVLIAWVANAFFVPLNSKGAFGMIPINRMAMRRTTLLRKSLALAPSQPTAKVPSDERNFVPWSGLVFFLRRL